MDTTWALLTPLSTRIAYKAEVSIVHPSNNNSNPSIFLPDKKNTINHSNNITKRDLPSVWKKGDTINNSNNNSMYHSLSLHTKTITIHNNSSRNHLHTSPHVSYSQRI